jgi:cell wall-associated protease
MKNLLGLIVPFMAFNAFAKTQVIPKAIEDLNYITKASKLYHSGLKGKFLNKALKADIPTNWFNLHHQDNDVQGVGSEKVYTDFGMPEHEIIVAVIDSGVDVNHEDLQSKIWINSDEIPNNGIDDDKNGYIDDVFGWNFAGGEKGMGVTVQDVNNLNGHTFIKGLSRHQVDADTLEVTRELVRMNKLKETRQRAGATLTDVEQSYLTTLDTSVRKEYTIALTWVNESRVTLEKFEFKERILKAAGFSAEMTYDNLSAFAATEPSIVKAKLFIMELLQVGKNKARLNRIISYFSNNMNYYYNTEFDARKIVGDDYFNLAERYYGNNDIIGPDSRHGTHVAGIIAANRANGIGMEGVAAKVKIMAIRCVPNGDERDKDVANAIRYAVDNGAKVINMSFGKGYSPYKSTVDEAVAYAEEKGVLLVHAAGNSSQDNNTTANFPNRKVNQSEVNNWLEIGAASWQKGLDLPASFSNFGSESVDFFAPGVKVFSTTPDNSYDALSGTSMASPVTAGVAALVLSYRPELNAESVRGLMIEASRRYPNLNVYHPGSREIVPFKSLSINGSSVDAYEIVKNL